MWGIIMNKSKIRKMALTLSLIELISLGKYTLNNKDTDIKLHSSVYYSIDPETKKIITTYTDEVEHKETKEEETNEDKLYKSNIYVDYDSEGNPSYTRYDEETNTYKPISIFDDENSKIHQYGGNQKDFKKNFTTLIQDHLIYNELQNYYPITLFESTEESMLFYKKYFNLINNYGCGYVSVANAVFHYFEGREKEFKNTFGYPMYKVDNKGNIDFNYEIFILKFFNYSILNRDYLPVTTDMIVKGLFKDIYEKRLRDYTNSDEYKKKIPDNFYELSSEEQNEWYKFDKMRNEKWHKLYDEWKNSDIELPPLALPFDESFGKIKEYLSTYNITASTIFNLYIYDGYQVDNIIGSDKFALYFESEEGVRHLFKNNIKSHYVYVTDSSYDGKPIVSSRGEKYVFDDTNAEWTSKLTLKLHKEQLTNLN